MLKTKSLQGNQAVSGVGVWPMDRLGHPEDCLFLLSNHNFAGSVYPQNIPLILEKKITGNHAVSGTWLMYQMTGKHSNKTVVQHQCLCFPN